MIENEELQRLTLKLQDKDRQCALLYKRLRNIYFLMVPFYAAISVIEVVENMSIDEIVRSVSYLAAMILIGVLMMRMVKVYGKVNYSLPTLQMLYQARLRYSFFPPSYGPLSVLSLIFLGLGIVMMPWEIVSRWVVAAIYVAILSIVYVWGYAYYKNNSKPMYDYVVDMIVELEHANRKTNQ